MLRMISLVLLILVFGCASTPEADSPGTYEPPGPPTVIGAEEPDTGNPVVKIMLRPQGSNEPRKIIVGPRGVGICESAELKVCGDTITFRWIGKKNHGEKIKIFFVDSSSTDAATSGPEQCFGKSSATITDLQKTGEVKFKARVGKCVPKGKSRKPAIAFFYTVSCEGGEGGDCGGVKPVDPGAMVDGGG